MYGHKTINNSSVTFLCFVAINIDTILINISRMLEIVKWDDVLTQTNLLLRVIWVELVLSLDVRLKSQLNLAYDYNIRLKVMHISN